MPLNVGEVRSISYSGDGKFLASAGADGFVRIWDVASGVQVRLLIGHAAAVNSVAFAKDGKIVASASDDKTVKVWDALTGQLLLTLSQNPYKYVAVAISPDSTKLVASYRGDPYSEYLDAWNLPDGSQRDRIGYLSWASYLTFSPDGSELAVSGGAYEAYYVSIRDAETGEKKTSIGNDYFYGIAYSSDGKWIAAGSGHNNYGNFDGYIMLANAKNLQENRDLGSEPNAHVMCVSFNPSKPYLLSGGARGRVSFWDFIYPNPIVSYTVSSQRVTGVAFSPLGGEYAVSGVVSGVAVEPSMSLSVPAAGYVVERGLKKSGDLVDIIYNDRKGLGVKNAPVTDRLSFPVTLIVEGRYVGTKQKLKLRIQHDSDATGLVQRVDLYDFEAGRYDAASLDTRAVMPYGNTVVLEFTKNLDRFFGPNGELRCRLRVRAENSSAPKSWSSYTDQVVWSVSP